jgi:ribonuclease E
MSDPLDTNDDWAELARELASDKPPAPPADRVERLVAPHHGDPRAEDEAAAEGEPEAADDEFEDGDDAPAGEAGEPAEGDQPGTGRKRRRRRRRRRKGTGAAAETGEPAAGAEAADEEPATEPVAEIEADDYAAADAAEGEGEPVPFGAEEDTASDVLRELIATWNVPSWGEIVDGLYRPN